VSVFLGNARNEALSEGLHIVMPYLTTVHRIDTRIQKVQAESFEAASKDLQSVRAAIVVNYHLKKEDVVKLFREIGIGYADVVILPGVSEVYKATTANFTAEALITQRQTVSEQIKAMLAERLEPYGIIVNQVNVVNFDFSSEFNRAIEAKVTAEQEALRAEKELEKVKFEAQQAKAKAEGEANAVLEKAKAAAESLKMRLEYAKPEVIMLDAVQKWDGKLPTHIFGQVPMPVFDVQETAK
jgi:regulator of protease activity HflC (stomatin/prohibitin superfamily)